MNLIEFNKLCKKGVSSLRQKDIVNDGPYPVYGASGIVGYSADYQNENRCVAVIKDGAGVGRACTCESKSSVLGTMQALIPTKGVDCDYLLHLVRSMKLGDGFTGSTIPHIYFKDYGKRLVIAHTESDQQHISKLLYSVEAQMAVLSTQSGKFDELVKSRFVEMFGNANVSEYVELQDVCSIITDGTHQPPKFVAEGIPFLFVSNVANNVITYDTQKYITHETYEQLIRRTPIEVGDVLVSAVGSFGHPAVVRSERPFCFQRHIAYLKPIHERINSDYLHSVLLTDEAQRYMDTAAKGVAQRTVTLKSFKTMRIPLPPLALQQEFAAFVQQVDKLKFVAQQQKDRLQMLYDSLAQKYFGVE